MGARDTFPATLTRTNQETCAHVTMNSAALWIPLGAGLANLMFLKLDNGSTTRSKSLPLTLTWVTQTLFRLLHPILPHPFLLALRLLLLALRPLLLPLRLLLLPLRLLLQHQLLDRASLTTNSAAALVGRDLPLAVTTAIVK
jgi:hypothetical protein